MHILVTSNAKERGHISDTLCVCGAFNHRVDGVMHSTDCSRLTAGLLGMQIVSHEEDTGKHFLNRHHKTECSGRPE